MRLRQKARREQLAVVARENIPALAQRPRHDDRLARRVRVRIVAAHDVDLVEAPIHRRPHEIHEPRIDHREGRAAPLLIRARALHIGDARHQRAARRDVVAARLDLQPQLAPRRRGEPLVAGVEKIAQRLHRDLRAVLAIVVRDAAAETHRRELREMPQQPHKLRREPRQIVVQLLKLRPAADVRVQHRHRQPRAFRRLIHRQQIVEPDPVLRARPARVARVHMSVPKSRIHPERYRPGVARPRQIRDLPRRPDIRQNAVPLHHLHRIVAEHIARQTDHRRLIPRRMPRVHRPQHLIARHRIDPDPRGAHLAQHLRRRTRLHREARLHPRRVHHELHIPDPLPDRARIINPERRADFFSERAEQGGFVVHVEKARDIAQPPHRRQGRARSACRRDLRAMLTPKKTRQMPRAMHDVEHAHGVAFDPVEDQIVVKPAYWQHPHILELRVPRRPEHTAFRLHRDL